jgi:hypothetical protein
VNIFKLPKTGLSAVPILKCVASFTIDAHRGGIKVYHPPSKIFAKLVNKNAIKYQKGVPYPQNFHNP